MKKSKNLFMKLVMIVLIIASLTSCVSDTDESQSAVDDNQANEDKIILDVWHLWTTETDGNSIAYKKALEAYQKIHPEVEIRTDSTENEAYKAKLKTAFSVNEAPDVFLPGEQVSRNHWWMQDCWQ